MNYITFKSKNDNLVVNNKTLSPVGAVVCFAGTVVPDGWLLCDGREVSKTTYAELYSTLGNIYGNPIDNSKFKLPNLTQKFPLGKSENNNLGELSGNSSITLTTNQLPSHTHTGTTNSDGIHNHTGTTTTDGNHNHTINDPGHTHTQTTINDDFNNSGSSPPGFSADSAGSRTWSNISTNTTGITINNNGSHSHNLNINNSTSHSHSFTTDSTGLGSSINIMNPYIVLNYLIKH